MDKIFMDRDKIKDVRKYYNDHVKDEDRRLDEHSFEIPITMHFVENYLTTGNSVFDVACGTGRIAELLLNKGYFVGLNDLSDKNIELVKERIGTHRNILFMERSDALESKRWGHTTWDSIFILGPLYHMISLKNRIQLLELAYENLKPGGYIFSSFMTRTGALVYGVKHNPKGILFHDGAKKLWETGTDNHFVEDTEYFTNAYFTHPEEINPMIESAGLKPLHLVGVEGIFGERFELYHSMDETLKAAWLDFIIENCEDTHLIQQSKHLLSIAQKP